MNTDFSARLLHWYSTHGRKLPWRGITDPYKIWISEIILQQTRVVQGYAYYLRFVERFPTVESLAEAAQDEVLKYWQGLGYYSRARNLHAAAQQVVGQGSFPASYEGLRALKGVGDYTAAAIASFAYNLPRAVVDGNVYRVLARYFNIDTPIDSSAGKKLFQALAQELIPVREASTYNQAIMDFGALQCVPKSPDCSKCPLLEGCEAWGSHRVDSLPVKQHTTKVRDRYLAYIYVSYAGKVLLRQRTGQDIWKGLYELPLVESSQPISPTDLERLDWVESPLTLLRKEIKHQLSHQLLHVDLYCMSCTRHPSLEGLWVDVQELDRYAVSKLMADLLTISSLSSC